MLFLDMARDFAKQFYRSVEWQHMRQYILIRDKYTCQRCHGAKHCGQLEVHHKIHLTPENIHDASIALNDSNLITLCRDCHFEVHEEDKLRGNGQRYEHEDCDSGMMFDENGYLVEKI